MIRSGELEGTPEELEALDQEEDFELHFSERVRGSFASGTKHLREDLAKGRSADDRMQLTIRLILILMGLGFAFWFFIMR